MRDVCRKYKREICIGVVVSLITTAILKFGDWLVIVAPSIGASIFETASNILYSFAATYTDNFLLRIFLFGCFGVLVGISASTIKAGIKVYKDTLSLEKKIKDIPRKKLGEISEQAIKELYLEKTFNGPESMPKLIQNGKAIGKASISLIVLITLMYLFIAYFVVAPMNLYNKFERDLIKIAPYIEENVITQLKSDWVCMRNKSDHDKIYVIIDKVKEEYSLPK